MWNLVDGKTIIFVADVSKPPRQMLLPLFVHVRLMLLPVVVLWQMLCHLICYGIFELADVIAKWLMELPLYDNTWLMLLPGD